MRSLVSTSTPSRPNSPVSQCAIPSITTIPWILAIGMLSSPPSSALRQLPPSCSYHLCTDPWSLDLTKIFWQPILTCVIILEQSLLMRSPTHLHIIAESGTQLREYTWIATILHGCKILPVTFLALIRTLRTCWMILNITNNPMRNARHAETTPGLKKFDKFHSDKNANYQVPPQTCLGGCGPSVPSFQTETHTHNY